MARITYVGPCTDGVTIAATDQHVGQGESIEVPDDLAAALCEQVTNWSPAKPSKPKANPAASEED